MYSLGIDSAFTACLLLQYTEDIYVAAISVS